MSEASNIRVGAPRTRALRGPHPPSWVLRLLDTADDAQISGNCDDLPRVHVRRSGDLLLLRTVIPDAVHFDATALHGAIFAAYTAIAKALDRCAAVPLRFWNYTPGICTPFPNGLIGYEIFNAARDQAFSKHFEGEDRPAGTITASAVDTRSGDFELHLIASRFPGTAIDNPRQIPPHCYSRRFGPVPPSFARALRVDGAAVARCGLPAALVAGTASIVGEESRHIGDLEAQLHEVLLNLATLVNSLDGRRTLYRFEHPLDSDILDLLARYTAIRAYVRHERDEAAITAWVHHVFPHLEEFELVGADLCRPELLVEVEGTIS